MLNLNDQPRAEILNPAADPVDLNAMAVDPNQPISATGQDQQNDPPLFSLNVTSVRRTMWAPISAFSDLKMTVTNLKN